MSNDGEMFPQTRWSQLARLKDGDETTKSEVLGTLYQLYRKPVLAYLARRGFGHEKAEDLVQDFFLHSMQHQLFEKAETARGRFRGLTGIQGGIYNRGPKLVAIGRHVEIIGNKDILWRAIGLQHNVEEEIPVLTDDVHKHVDGPTQRLVFPMFVVEYPLWPLQQQ